METVALNPECIQAQKDIDRIEAGFSNPDSISYKTILNKGEILRVLAASYETLSLNNIIDVPVDHIAHYIMKRVTQLNTNLSSTRIYDSLPAKYKYHRAPPIIEDNGEQSTTYSRNGNESSSLYTDYTTENKPEIDFYHEQIELCKKIISHLKKEPYLLKTDTNNIPLIDIEEYDNDLIIRQAAQTLVSETFDNRKTVLTNTIHLLLQAFLTYNNKYAAGIYIGKLKDYGIQKKDQSIKTLQKLFTPKQLGKILKGETKELHESFEILNQDDAYENGFYGKCACPECGSWRVKLSETYNYTKGEFTRPRLHCHECMEDSDAPRVKLPMSTPTPIPITD